MKIYYFGELIEDTNTPKETTVDQLTLTFADQQPAPEPKKTGMDSIGDILKDLDLNLDVYRPLQFSN